MSREILVTLLSGVLAFIGAISGTYLSSHLEEQRSDRQFNQQYRVHILDKRISIIDDCSRATYALPRDKAIRDRYGKNMSLEMVREVNGIEIDYARCLQMAGIMFGPKSHDAASVLQKIRGIPDLNDDNQAHMLEALVLAMVEEAPYKKQQNSH